MKLKYLVSIIGSFFLLTTVKSQKTPVKKETVPQVKKTPEVTTPVVNKDGKISQKDAVSGKIEVDGKMKVENKLPDKTVKMADSKLPGKVEIKPGKDKSGVSGKEMVSRSAMEVKSGDILYNTNFNTDEIGEMPKGWKTNTIGTLVNVDSKEGKWLKLEESTKYETAFTGTLPENYKIEFDFIGNYKSDQRVPDLVVKAYKKGKDFWEPGVSFLISPNGGSVNSSTRIEVFSNNDGGGEKFRSTARHLNVFEPKNGTNEAVHVVLIIKGESVKAYLDGEKVYDLQEVVQANIKFDRVAFELTSYGGPRENYNFLISNFKISVE